MRCTSCGAHNHDEARWCNQCFTDLLDPARRQQAPGDDIAPPAAGSARPESAATGRPTAGTPERDAGGRAAGAAGGVSLSATGEGFRATDEGLEWQCPRCASWSPIAADRCDSCQAPFASRIAANDRGGQRARPRGEPVPLQPRTVETGRVMLLNALLPGAGHIAAGWIGSGLARLVLYCVWVVGGAAISSAGGAIVAAPLLLGAAILWLASMHDGWQLRERGPQLLNGRALLWLVIGVTVLTLAGVAIAAVVATNV